MFKNSIHWLKDFVDPHEYAPDEHANIFDPPAEDDNYFSDIDEYDNLWWFLMVNKLFDFFDAFGAFKSN